MNEKMKYPIRIEKYPNGKYEIVEQGCGCCEEFYTIEKDENSRESLFNLLEYLLKQSKLCEECLKFIGEKNE